MTVKKTVKEFITIFNKKDTDKPTLIRKIILTGYVPYLKKIDIATRIINATCFKYVEGNSTPEIQIKSPFKYMLYVLNLINLYTVIDIDFEHENPVDLYDALNENGIIEAFISTMSTTNQKELEEFQTVLNMVYDDFITNNMSTNAIVNKIIVEFGEMVTPIIAKAVEQMDTKK